MPLKSGEIVEGTVKTITNFGAFIDLGEGKTGLVHISEVADGNSEKNNLIASGAGDGRGHAACECPGSRRYNTGNCV